MIGDKRNMLKIVESKKEYWTFLAGILLILLALSRYIVNGEPVDVRSEVTGAALALYDGEEIAQPLVMPEDVSWRQGYYALFFTKCDSASGGQLVCTLEQGEVQSILQIPLNTIAAGEWTSLKKLDFGKLKSGEAALFVRTEGVAEGELEIAVGQDYYGFGDLWLNGSGRQETLVQAYHYHILGAEYWMRLACYGAVILCTVILALLVRSTRTGIIRKETAAFGVLTVMFLAVIYLLDSSIYLEPTYAEAVTNFLRYAREEKLAANLLITDAGYLPLLPRLITLFYVKLLRIPSRYALYFMQSTACLMCSMTWSLFVLPPFQRLMRFSNRIIWCILVMLTCFCEETLFFTNLAYWGIYLLLLLLIADLDGFPGWVYAVLLCAGALSCLSKGTYVVMLPLMILYLFLFRKSTGRRDRIYAYVVGSASLLQLLYAFGGQGDGGGWIDTASMEQIGYWARLAARTFTEFGAYLLAPAGQYIQRMPGLVMVGAGTVVIIFLLMDFIRTVLIPGIHGEIIEKQREVFYTVVMFQLMVSVFFLVTVKRVPGSWSEMGKIHFTQMGDKYEIFSNMGFYMLLLTGSSLLAQAGKCGQRDGDFRNINDGLFDRACGRYSVLLLTAAFCLTNPVMRLNGWVDAKVSDGRVYAGDISASWWNFKDMISESSFFIPVRGGDWAYSRNVNLYQVGAETYFEETSGINLEEEIDGYHSMYEVQDAAQTENMIEVMINRPARMDETAYRVRLLDADNNMIAEAGQADAGRNKKCIFRLEEPVSGVKTIQLVDEAGNPAYYKDYIAWACAW